MKPGIKFPRNSKRKSNRFFLKIGPPAIANATAVSPHFNRTRLKSAASTALQLHFNRKVLERNLQK
jgi:hypothetical protein